MTLSDFDAEIEALKVRIIAMKLQGAELSKEFRTIYEWDSLNRQLRLAIHRKEKWRRQQIVIERDRRKRMLKVCKFQQRVSAAVSKKQGSKS